jgi:hypothetical protein
MAPSWTRSTRAFPWARTRRRMPSVETPSPTPPAARAAGRCAGAGATIVSWRQDETWFRPVYSDHPQPRSRCTGGQGTLPYEQNTQQSPGFACSNFLQDGHSQKNKQAPVGMRTRVDAPHSGQVTVLARCNVGAVLPALGVSRWSGLSPLPARLVTGGVRGCCLRSDITFQPRGIERPTPSGSQRRLPGVATACSPFSPVCSCPSAQLPYREVGSNTRVTS